MKLHELAPAQGSVQDGWRVGRGMGTGNGKTSGRGHKGQKARSGYSRKRGFEGGQMPLARRLPKRGFHNIFAKPLTAVNVGTLNAFNDGDIITAESLLQSGALSGCEFGLKILGGGELNKKITVKAQAFSETAAAKIAAAGGKAEVVKRA